MHNTISGNFGKKGRAFWAARAVLALGFFGAFVPGSVWADVVVENASKYGDTVTKTAAESGTQYEITNQQLSSDGTAALNRFDKFDLGSADIANLHMGGASQQINIVNSKINIDGVVNALKDNKIAGDVYFMSENGIAVGKTGVFNVGRLTLGTNTDFLTDMFTAGKMSELHNLPAKERSQMLTLRAGSGDIDFAGTVNAAESAVFVTNGKITVPKGAVIRTGANFKELSTPDTYRAPLLNVDGIASATEAQVTSGGIALIGGGDVSVSGTLQTVVPQTVKKDDGKPVAGEDISIQSGKNLTIGGATLKSDGGAIRLTAVTDTADGSGDPGDKLQNGYIVIRDAYIDSSSSARDAGKIEITAVRTAMGSARVDVDDSTITAEGKKGQNAGNVTIHATAQTDLWNWAIGDGVYARIKMGKKSLTGNTIIGDNIEITTASGTKGNLADKDGKLTKTEAEIEAAIKTSDKSTLKEMVGGFAKSFMAIGAVTSVESVAEVDIQKTNLSAVGTAAGGTGHGDLKVQSSAASVIDTFNLGGLGHGWNVGISDIKSTVTIDNSRLYAQKDMNLASYADNTVKMALKDMSLLTDYIYTGLVVSVGDLSTYTAATVGSNATLTAGGDVAVSAKSNRTFSATTSGFGKVAAAVTVGIVDTHSIANVSGKVYAGGDVTAHAETTMSKTGNVYNPDTAWAISATGDSAIAPATNAFSNYAKPFWNYIKSWFGAAGGNNQAQELSNKWGINGAASILMTDNIAEANVSGLVRGLSSTKKDGRFVGGDSVAAKSLAVTAETVARTSNVSGVYQFESTDKGPDGEEESKRKEKTVGIAVSYTSQKNRSDAAITGDVKTTGNVTVDAKTRIPWETSYASGDAWSIVRDSMIRLVFGRDNDWFYPLVDSWSQTAGKAEDSSYAASIVWMDYDNSAKAHIGKTGNSNAAKVDAGGDVAVNGKTDVTTVNFAGSIPTILKSSPAMFWKRSDIFNIDGLDPTKAAEQGLGGSLLWMKQKNTTDAYIEGGAKVTSGGKTEVKAKTDALNLGITTAGGAAKTVAFDASVGLNGITNTTKARIENSNVTASSLVLSSEDFSRNINLAGGVGIGGAKGIGASVAYTSISRTTEATLSGNLKITGDADVNAKNSGSIVAVSVAGAVTYDVPQRDVENDAGSVGIHFADEDGNDQGMELEDLYSSFDSGSEGGSALSRSESAFEEMAGNDAAGQQEVAEAKKSWAVAADMALNSIHDTAKAHVTKQTAGNSVIAADALRVNSLNDSLIFAGSGTVAADTTEEKGNAIAGSFMYNAVNSTNEAYVDGATLTLTGTKKKDDKDKVIDEALTVAAKNTETITNIAASGSGTSKGNSVAGQISLNLIDNTVKAHVKDAAVSADKAMTIKAEDAGTINSYTGAFSIAKDEEGKAVGASLGVNIIKGNMESFAENTSFGAATNGKEAGSLSVSAEEKSDLTSIVASASGSGKFAGGFSISGSSIDNTVKAYVSGNKALDIATLSVSAGNHGTSTVGVGALGVSKDTAVGASLAVMVNHSTVTAYAAGDEKQNTEWKMKELSVTADNAYNGSASDSDDDSKAKVVAIGAAGGKDLFAGSGSITVSHVKQTTDAYLGKGKYNIQDGDVTIKAQNKANLFGMAGGLSISKGTGVGAAIDVQKYIGHTYGGIKSGAILGNATKVDVIADSSEKMTSIAAAAGFGFDKGGGAGAAGAHDVTTDTKAYIGEDEKDAAKTELLDAGDVSVTASDATTLSTGSGAAGGSAKGVVGAGLSAAVEVVNKKSKALVGKNTYISDTTKEKDSSLTVKAINTGNSKTAAAALGVTAGEGVGVAGSASETFVDYTTKAYIGENAYIEVNGDTAITADSSFTQGAGAGGAGGGATGGVGLTNSTVSFTGTTDAYLSDYAWVLAGAADITATHKTDLTYATVAGGVGGQVGVSGTVGANVLKTTTRAYTGKNANVVSYAGTSFSATDDTTFSGGNGGLGIGLGGGGGGVAIAVAKVVKDTEAYAGHGTVLRSEAGDVSIAAKNTENLTNISVQGSGGAYFGLAGAVNVNYLNAVTKAYTESNVEIGAELGNVFLDATHEVSKWMSGVYGASGAMGAIGAAIDVGVIRTQTNAYLGAANTVEAEEGTLSINAKDHMKDMKSNAVAAVIGTVGVSGSISVYNFGNTLSDSDEKLTSGKTKEGGETVKLEKWLDEAMNQSDVGSAMGVYKHSALGDIQGKTKEKVSSEAPEMAGEKGTLAAIGAATDVDAKNVRVKADDSIDMYNGMGNGSASGVASAGTSVSVVNMDTKTQTRVGKWASVDAKEDITMQADSTHKMTNVTVGASVAGMFSLQGTEETWNDASHVLTTIGENSRISTYTPGKITIGASNTRIFDSSLVGATAGLYGAINGAVITSSVTGSAETTVENGSYIGGAYDTEAEDIEKPDVEISSKADTKLVAGVVGAGAGTFSGTGTGTSLSSDVMAKTKIANNATLAGGDISVAAENTPILKATARAAGAGAAAVGVTVAKTVSTDKALVNVGDGARFYAGGALAVQAAMKKPTDTQFKNAYANATAGAGGVVAGSVAVSYVKLNQETGVDIGKSVQMYGKTVTLLSDHKDNENLLMNSVGVGALSGAGGNLRVYVTSNSHVKMDDDSVIFSQDETVIAAHNESERDPGSEHTSLSVGAAIAAGSAVDSATEITHNTSVDLGKVDIVANATLTDAEAEKGVSVYDKNAIAIEATSKITSKEDHNVYGGSVAAAIANIDSVSTATANTSVAVAKEATLTAGDVYEAGATGREADYAGTDGQRYDVSYRGGSIAIGTRNDANISSDTIVDVTSQLVGAAASSNDVTYNNNLSTTFDGAAETAKGDISIRSGRDAQAKAGDVNVEAHSDVLSISVVPITGRGDPLAKIAGESKLTIGANANLRSDRDIYLAANKGDLDAKGTGESKSWVTAIRDIFADKTAGGKSEVSVAANVEMNGKAETGIHRNKSITVGGHVGTDGKWITTVTSDGGISYAYSASIAVESELFTRYDELKKLLADYGGGEDSKNAAAKAAYEAELAFLEEKMVEEGMGYFQTLENGQKLFVRMAHGTGSELSEAELLISKVDEETGSTESAAVKARMESQLEAAKAQMNQFKELESEKSKYDAAVSLAMKTRYEMEAGAVEFNQVNTELLLATDAAGFASTEDYIEKNPNANLVKRYQTALENYEKAQTAKANAETALADAKTSFLQVVTEYNQNYARDFETSPDRIDTTEIAAENKILENQQKICQRNIDTFLNAEKLKTQVEATKKFFAEGGSEDENGNFLYDGQKWVTVDATGTPVDESKDGAIYLLHSRQYEQMTHAITVGEITAQLGDILFEGDNVYGSGTLSAATDATITVTNNSPNHLVVGDVKIMGRGGTTGTDQGGNVYYNGRQLEATENTVVEQIKALNKDAKKVVSFTTTTEANTAAPAVVIQNEFRPSAYLDTDNAPIYMASGVKLSGYIYNPRGSVNVTSAYGDISNQGNIYAGSVKIDVKNGDYIQATDLATNGSITSVGGNPMNAKGEQVTIDDTGIQANGNIFISARYLNINSKIQSGTAAKKVEIPSKYKIYYMDGSEKQYVLTITEEAKKHPLLVADQSGNPIDGISYDWETDRFVVEDTKFRGGHISLVGTIINTTNDTSKARIEALDGYGGITVENKSDKDLEIQALSTGDGKKGKIEITDLDRSTGKITRKTTYTREDGQILMSVQNYENGQISGDPQETRYAENKGVYTPTSGSYYNYQIGVDKSAIDTYIINETRMDWWGIQDKTPTAEEMIAKGATKTRTEDKTPKVLNGGAFVGTTNVVANSGSDGVDNASTVTGTGEAYKVSKTQNIGDVTPVSFEKSSKRLWYTIWLAKKYKYTLVQKTGYTDITQYSMKADYDIGIGFNGNANGGTIDVKGGSQNIYLNGMIQNGAGKTALSGKNIVQQSKAGYVKTGSLELTATENAGTKEALIRTDATSVSGTAEQNFGVDVLGGSVNVGNVTAGGTAVVQAEGGDILQKVNAVMNGNRVELVSGGVIRGADAASFQVKTGQAEGADYGLKASANGDINIENTSGDLYIDSVISEKGNVTLKTNGSFLDNNFTDYDNASATEKLLHWANEAILEGESTTIQKQKDLLTAKVYGKYSEYTGMAAFVKEGKYQLDDVTKDSLKNSGMTDADIATYVADRQKRYDELVALGVDKWTKEGVEAYTKSIADSTDTTIYGNASLKKDALSTDTYLTADEKAACLVGSSASAKALLISFTSGGIKEGITDTNTTLKETPHVSGASITLKATGKNSEAHTGNIGEKKTGMTIDISDLRSLTSTQLLALSSAERGDFKIDGDLVTLSTVRPIDAETTGVMTAMADKGAVYLVGTSGYKEGSTFFGADEIRLKTSGDLAGIKAGSDGDMVLESGSGAIKDVTVTGSGVLTARAKDGVAISKEDGNLIINTVYASEGDVSLNLNGHSLLAVSGNDDESEGAETGTTYVNIEGENIAIDGAKDIKGQSAKSSSLGMKVTGTKAEDGSTTSGKMIVNAQGEGDITISGDLGSEDTAVSAADLTLTNRGNISDGTFTGTNALSVYNTKDGNVSGGTFISGQAGSGLTLTNEGQIADADFTANSGDVTVKNSGVVTGMDAMAANGSVSVANSGNSASLSDSSLLAKNDVTYVGANGATGTDLTASAETGSVTMTADKDLSVKKLAATKSSRVESQGAVRLDEANVADALIVNAGKALSAKKLTTGSDATLSSGDSMTVLDSEIGKTLAMTSGKDISVNRSQSVTLNMNAQGSIETMGSNASISSGDVTMTAGENIHLTDKQHVKKLDGVDTNKQGSETTGVGHSGSIFFGDVAAEGFDVSQKGSSVLSATGNLTLSGKTVEADTVKTDSHADITADNLGIDDLQSEAKELTVSIHGQGGKQTHHAGIHTTSSGAVTIQNSAIEQLNFTGIDDIGLSNTALGGDSTMQTERVYFSLQKNPANGLAEWIGNLRLKGISIDTDVPFTRVDGGILINGDSPDFTAHEIMKRSLYGLRGLGAKDAEQEEEEEKKNVSGGIRFGRVSEAESYHPVGRA